MSAKLPMQEPKEFSWKASMEALRHWTNFLIFTFLASFFVSRYFQGTFCYVMAYMRYCQVTLHLPMASTPITSNLMFFCNKFLAFPRIDIFWPFFERTRDAFKLDFDNQFRMREVIPDQVEDLGYRTTNPMLNLNSLLFYVMVLVFLMPVYWILLPANQYCGRKRIKLNTSQLNLSRKLRERQKQIEEAQDGQTTWRTQLKEYIDLLGKHLFFRWILALFIVGYMEFLIAGTLGVASFTDKTGFESFSNLAAAGCLVMCLIIVPCYYLYLSELASTDSFTRSNLEVLPLHFAHVGVKATFQGHAPFYLCMMAHRAFYIFLMLIV